MSNNGEYKSIIGLDNLYIAEVTQDDSGAYVAGTPEWLAPAAEATLEPTTNNNVQYADNKPYETMMEEGETTVSLTITGLPIGMQAFVLGKVFDAAAGRVYDNKGIPPYLALGFRSQKSNGKYRYYWFLKGRFAKPGEAAATKTDTPDPKTMQLVYTAIHTEYLFDLGDVTDSVLRVYGDEDADNFSGTTWFSAVQTPDSTAAGALALSSSTPADGGTGLAVGANVTLTFSNRLRPSAVSGVVLTTAAGAAVAGAVTLDAAGKIVTINPTSNLGAATAHLVTYSVTDIYGQTLVGVIDFTTA